MRHRAARVIVLAPILFVAQAQGVVGRLAPVSEFTELPAAIAHDLTNRGCLIPQVKGISRRQNVIRGEFQKRGQRDWAVLCLKGETSTILVYTEASGSKPVQLAPMDETIAPDKDGYYRVLQVAGEEFIRRHADASASDMDRPPAILDHDGIDDGIFEKGSSVHYFYRGKWLKLAGSD
jgi:hypothetical protein